MSEINYTVYMVSVLYVLVGLLSSLLLPFLPLSFLSSSSTGSLSPLLRELVTEFTLTDNLANTTTSLLRSMCHHDDSILLGSWLEETDHQDVEEQLQLNSAAGSGALEHDPSCVYITSTRSEVCVCVCVWVCARVCVCVCV